MNSLSVQTRFWQQMSPELGLSFERLNNAQSANSAGLAMGCIFFIPITKKYGRRSTYVVSTAAMAAVSWWSTYMKTDAELFLTNLFYGLAGATNETVVQMTVSPQSFGLDLNSIKKIKALLIVYANCLDRRHFLCPPTRHS